MPTASSSVAAVAGGLARVVADPAHDGGERVVRHDLAPRRLVVALLGVVEPPLDVLAGRAGVVARRQQVHVDRPLGAPGAGLVGQAGADVQRDREGLVHHCSSRSEQPEPADVAVGAGLDLGDDVGALGRREQVGVALLGPQVVLDRHLVAGSG